MFSVEVIHVRKFFPRDAILGRYMLWNSVCVCMSVRLSVTSRFVLKCKIFVRQNDAARLSLVFLCQRSGENSKWLTPSGDAKYTHGEEKFGLLTSNSRYRENGTRLTSSFWFLWKVRLGSPIGTVSNGAVADDLKSSHRLLPSHHTYFYVLGLHSYFWNG